jgi:hypothetical protein
LKHLIDETHLDLTTRQEVEREARRLRYEALDRYVVAPLVAMCKRTFSRRLATLDDPRDMRRRPACKV